MIYCVVIGTCQQMHELGRATEWTRALAGWCDTQPDFTGAYRGLCRVHRVAVLVQTGVWQTAEREARLACAQLTEGYGEFAAGGAYYQLAEVHRLRGEFADADQAYRAALGYGHNVQPGLALLRLAQGRIKIASAGIRRALAETTRRAGLLPAAVEIALAGGDLDAASRFSAELSTMAGTSALRAMADYCAGAVCVAAGHPAAALTPLRAAHRRWHDLSPYEAARCQLLIAQACLALGDDDTAAMEGDAAAAVLLRLGASSPVRDKHGLTGRELEVVRLLADGRTNRDIAAHLRLSEKTVARHVSNIFGKLSVGSRTAVAAYAYEHRLL
jgi:DNA-binding CsgD family transcriptional regulator